MRKTRTKREIRDMSNCMTSKERTDLTCVKSKNLDQRVNVKEVLKEPMLPVAHRVYYLRAECFDQPEEDRQFLDYARIKHQEFLDEVFEGEGRETNDMEALHHMGTPNGPLSTDEGVDELIAHMGL